MIQTLFAYFRRFRPPLIPVSFFSMVLGLAGLGNSWRVAHRIWGLPSSVGESINAIAAALWAILLILYISKWLFGRRSALDEFRHPIDCSFVGLIGVATMLVAGIAVPYSRAAALILFATGALFTLIYAVWQTGGIWQNDRHHSTTTAVLYLPTVAGSFVTATVAASLGFREWGQLAFGAGLFSWLAIESVLAHRLYAVDRLPVAQRPSLGIQFAPPVVAGVAYMSITRGPPDLFASALVGYGILQGLVVLRLLNWIRQQPFGPSYWAFTFGSASLATTLLLMVERGGIGPAKFIAPVAFIAANLVVGTIFLATLRLLLMRRLIPILAEVEPSEPGDQDIRDTILEALTSDRIMIEG
ncbi:dicarboxylate transporter/tellurite-resistance protein TehA [Gluconobacter albidus]|uniref:dicarboxylate transporter/tellurite-resistance protein TehA n=1 Tax=Gluconobacter albidus TaxID=318683 RepID=UPI000A8F23D2|nr:dicarboxylate transporter/tellurite-resistance protein TehA [Gluconobacter albidus]